MACGQKRHFCCSTIPARYLVRAACNPVVYLADDARDFIWAANAGAPKHRAWYHNLKEHPVTRIEVSGETIDVVAEEATGDERDRLFARAAGRYPQLADIAGKTERIIPLMVLTPRPNS